MGHSHDEKLDVKEYIDKYNKFEWMLTLKHDEGLLGKLLHKEHHELHVPEFKDFQEDTLNNKEKIHFVLLALEKLHHIHPGAIPVEDSKYLHTANIGTLYKAFHWAAHIPLIYLSLKMVQSRNFGLKIFTKLFGYAFVLHSYILPFPFAYKEYVRRIRARPIALKYFMKNNGKLDLFKKILDPRTHPHALHHMKL